MEHLFNQGLRKCGYETLEFEFTQHVGTNEPRVLMRYLGRPEKREIHRGTTRTIRINQTSGKTARFIYDTETFTPAKKGLLEKLGYIEPTEEGRYVLRHDRLGYSLLQTVLPTIESEEEKPSKDKMCVQTNTPDPLHHTDVEDKETQTENREEREVIDPTHTFQLSESNQSQQNTLTSKLLFPRCTSTGEG
jgi:hypothetical protein